MAGSEKLKVEHNIGADEGFMHTNLGDTTVFEAENWQKVIKDMQVYHDK